MAIADLRISHPPELLPTHAFVKGVVVTPTIRAARLSPNARKCMIPMNGVAPSVKQHANKMTNKDQAPFPVNLKREGVLRQ
jgi:hypothetical protein